MPPTPATAWQTERRATMQSERRRASRHTYGSGPVVIRRRLHAASATASRIWRSSTPVVRHSRGGRHRADGFGGERRIEDQRRACRTAGDRSGQLDPPVAFGDLDDVLGARLVVVQRQRLMTLGPVARIEAADCGDLAACPIGLANLQLARLQGLQGPRVQPVGAGVRVDPAGLGVGRADGGARAEQEQTCRRSDCTPWRPAPPTPRCASATAP